MSETPHSEVEAAALRLLTGREHSRQELQGKLYSRGYPPEPIEQVLDALVKKGLQSDSRFAEAYVYNRVSRGNGPLRIRAELRERGIGESLIAEFLDYPTDQWWDGLRRVHDNKFGQEPPCNTKERAKRARFLAYRGFPSDMIRQLLFHPD